ncbi:MAG TPA: hypothetical protein VHQ46_01615, partial [Desulfobacteria bacterium]|nr:hypothetical protein [Desulfobacteria bacterium]
MLELRMLHKLKATTWLNLRTISLLVVYALFWLFIGLIAHDGLERQVFLVLAQTTGGLVADSVAGEFSVQDFGSGFSLDQLNQLDRQFANYSGKNVQEIKIFNLQGRVLYANDKSDIGKIEFNDLKLIEPKRTTASLDGERLVLFVPIQAGPEHTTVGTLEVYLVGGAVIRFLNYMQLV